MYLQEILFFHTEINVPTRKKFENQANKKEIKRKQRFSSRRENFLTAMRIFSHGDEKIFSTRREIKKLGTKENCYVQILRVFYPFETKKRLTLR